jgi:hypothetical protein
MASTPTFPSTPRQGDVTISTANTARDGTGTLGTILSAAAAGTHVYGISITAGGTTTAGVVRIFISNDNGTTKRLLEEILVAAFTPSTTVAVWSGASKRATWAKPIILGASTNNILYASTHNAETFYVHADAGDLT